MTSNLLLSYINKCLRTRSGRRKACRLRANCARGNRWIGRSGRHHRKCSRFRLSVHLGIVSRKDYCNILALSDIQRAGQSHRNSATLRLSMKPSGTRYGSNILLWYAVNSNLVLGGQLQSKPAYLSKSLANVERQCRGWSLFANIVGGGHRGQR